MPERPRQVFQSRKRLSTWNNLETRLHVSPPSPSFITERYNDIIKLARKFTALPLPLPEQPSSLLGRDKWTTLLIIRTEAAQFD